MQAGEIARIVVIAVILGLAAPLALYLVGRSKASPPDRASGNPPYRFTYQSPVRIGEASPPTVAVAQSPAVRVVSNVPQRTLSRTGASGPQPQASTVMTAWPPQTSTVSARVGIRTPIVLRPIDRPYWELRHWQLVGDRLVGFYRTPYGSFEGYILHPQRPRPEFYIIHPPEELKEHRHWICFHSIGGDSYSIHFSPAPENPDAGILEVEKVLGEALTGRGRRNA